MKRLVFILALASLACGLQTTGAVSVPLLAPKPASIKSDTMVSNTMRVTVEMLNFRTDAGEDKPLVKGIPYLTFGDIITLTGNAKTTTDGAQWVECNYNGHTGWINARYAEVK